MHLDFLFKVFAQSLDAEAIIWRNKTFTYGWLLDRTRKWEAYLEDAGVTPGMVVALEADFSPTSVALFLALTEKACIQVPLTKAVETKKDEFKESPDIKVGRSQRTGSTCAVSPAHLSSSNNHRLNTLRRLLAAAEQAPQPERGLRRRPSTEARKYCSGRSQKNP